MLSQILARYSFICETLLCRVNVNVLKTFNTDGLTLKAFYSLSDNIAKIK